MAANDLLYLICERPGDRPDEVPWPVLTVITEEIAAATEQVLWQLASKKGFQPSRPGRGAYVSVLLAAAPTPGSLIVPLTFELTRGATDLLLAALASVPAGTIDSARDYLGTIIDAGTLLYFARDLLFGGRGLLARRLELPPPPAPENAADRAIDLMAVELLVSAVPIVESLIEVAQQSGLSKLDVQVGDQMAISLVMADVAVTRTLLGRGGNPSARIPVGQPQPLMRKRTGLETLRVRFEGVERLAMLFSSIHREAATSPGQTVAIWAAPQDLPEPGTIVMLEGEYVNRNFIEPLEKIPSAFWTATGPFVVRAARNRSDAEN